MIRIVRKRMFEMAFDKKRYKNFVYGEAPQIAQNWCLCMYCKMHRPDLKDTYIHWRSELELHINNLNSISLEKPKHRTKMTYEAMIIDEDMDDNQIVFKMCRIKFRHENEGRNGRPKLNMSIEHQKEVCALFSENVEDVVKCIGSVDILSYIRSEFPDNY